jgi:hypothetical protein
MICVLNCSASFIAKRPNYEAACLIRHIGDAKMPRVPMPPHSVSKRRAPLKCRTGVRVARPAKSSGERPVIPLVHTSPAPYAVADSPLRPFLMGQLGGAATATALTRLCGAAEGERVRAVEETQHGRCCFPASRVISKRSYKLGKQWLIKLEETSGTESKQEIPWYV